MGKLKQYLMCVCSLLIATQPAYASNSAKNVDETVISETAATIPDLWQASPWAQEAIIKVKDKNIMRGDVDGMFHPTVNISRREMAVVLTQLLSLEVHDGINSPFKDVPHTDWGVKYIESVSRAGVMVGGGEDRFHPDDKITREEMATILVRATKKQVTGKGNDLQVLDRNSISSWARDYVQTAIEMSLMVGDQLNFYPKRSVQRQEVAKAIDNYLEIQSRENQVPVIKKIEVERNSLKVHETIKISVVLENDIPGVSYHWTASGGHLIGNNSKQIIWGSSSPGKFTVRVEVSLGEKKTFKEVEIEVGQQSSMNSQR